MGFTDSGFRSDVIKTILFIILSEFSFLQTALWRSSKNSFCDKSLKWTKLSDTQVKYGH